MTSEQELKEETFDISYELRQLQIRMIFVSRKIKNLADDAHHQELRNASAIIGSWIAGIEETFL